MTSVKKQEVPYETRKKENPFCRVGSRYDSGCIPKHCFANDPAEEGGIIYVDVDATLETADGTQEHPYSSIQEAVNAAAEGDTIKVAPGEYDVFIEQSDAKNNAVVEAGIYSYDVEHNLLIWKGVTIEAADPEDPPVLTTEWTGGGNGSSQQTVFIVAGNVTLKNLIINVTETEPNKAIEVAGGYLSGNVENVTIDSCVINGGDVSAIYIGTPEVGAYTIKDNEITGSISITNGAGNAMANDEIATISNNVIDGYVLITGTRNTAWNLNSIEKLPVMTQNNILGADYEIDGKNHNLIVLYSDMDEGKLPDEADIADFIAGNQPDSGWIRVRFTNGNADDPINTYPYYTECVGVICDPVTLTTADGVTTAYTDLHKAIKDANDGGIIQLYDDVTITEALSITKDITVNGNHNTLTADGCVGFFIRDDLSSFTVNDLTLQGVLPEGAAAGEGSTGPYMGIGTYNGCYGVEKLELNNVTIDGFSYGLYFGKNPAGTSDTASLNNHPVKLTANDLTIQNCYIKGAYLEKLTDSTFTDCRFIDNGADPQKVQASFQTWMCGVDINLKNGIYQNISFVQCLFDGNGANNGTALHIKARADGNYGADTALMGVTVSDCTFVNNNGENPVVFGEPGKNNPSPVNISIQPDVTYANHVANTVTATFVDANGETFVSPTQIVAGNSLLTLPTPEKDGFVFTHWTLGESTYSGGDTVEISANAVFTANWTEKEADDEEDDDKPTIPSIPPTTPDEDEDPEDSPSTGPDFDEIPENGFAVDNNGDTYFFEDGNMVTGWVEMDDTWYYMNTDSGKMVSDDWQQVNGTWYYLKDWGGMATGWQRVNGTWYYLKDWGGMATGWQRVNGKWYYLYADGSMAANTSIGGYVLGADDAMK